MGGIGLGDPGQGQLYQLWTGEVLNLRSIYVSSPNTPRTLIYSASYQITELSITFDQNMRPYAAFVERGYAKLFWYNSQIAANDILTLPAGSRNPKIMLDDKRLIHSSESNIYLFYMRGTTLYYRQQSDRFAIENVYATGIAGDLLIMGLNTGYRLQFTFGIKKTYDELLNGELAAGSPIASSTVVISDDSSTPSDSDIWELDRDN
jgi:hypothetical protein